MKQKIKLKRRKLNLRPLIGASIFTSTLLGVFLAPKPVLALCENSPTTSAGTTITNQAAVSYDDGDGNDYEQVSNTVEVKVAEIAGVTVQALGVSDPNLSSRNTGDVVAFEFLVTNTGNDPTYIFLPGSNNIALTGATFAGVTGNTVAITAINGVDVAPVAVPAAGASTSALTSIGNNGFVLPGQTLKVAVRVIITETRATFPVGVQYGDTAPNDNSSATQNQENAGADPAKVYTIDGPDAGSTGDPCDEAPGEPVNGEREAAAKYSFPLNTQSNPLALLKVGKTLVSHNPQDATTLADNLLTYRLDLTNDSVQIDPNFEPGILKGKVTVTGISGLSVIVSDRLPAEVKLHAPLANVNIGTITWVPIYLENAGATNITAAAWSTTYTALTAVTHVGYAATVRGTPVLTAANVPIGYTTTTDTTGLPFTVITSEIANPETAGTTATICNIAQGFGLTVDGNDNVTIYDESGDAKPNNYSDDGTAPSISGSRYLTDGTNGYDGTAIGGVNNLDTNNNNTGVDADPSVGRGENNCKILNLDVDSSRILNGPLDNPDATGPTSNNDDFFEKPSDPSNPTDPIEFGNTVQNPTINISRLNNVVLLPLTASQASATTPGSEDFGSIPNGTRVTIAYDDSKYIADDIGYGNQVAVYEYDETNDAWYLVSGTNLPIKDGYHSSGVTIETILPGEKVNYTVTIDPPDSLTFPADAGTVISVPIVAYPENTFGEVTTAAFGTLNGTIANGVEITAGAGGATFDPAVDTTWNIKIDRLLVGGFLEVIKEVRLLSATGAELQPYTQNPADPDGDGTGLGFDDDAWTAEPGQILQYRITYRNLATPTTGGSGSISLTANNLVITENGVTAPNNWALDNDSNGDPDTVHINNGAIASRGTITYTPGGAVDPVTGTNVTIYVNNVGTLPAGQTGTFTFRRLINY